MNFLFIGKTFKLPALDAEDDRTKYKLISLSQNQKIRIYARDLPDIFS